MTDVTASGQGQAAQNPTGPSQPPRQQRRDYSIFDADLSGAVLDMSLIGRVLTWLAPYRDQLIVSSILVIASSTLAVLLPVIMSIVTIDYVLRGETPGTTFDFGLIDLVSWLHEATGLPLLLVACLLFAVTQLAWAITGHYHRMTLVAAVVNGLRDLRRDLFRHIETRPSSFFDRVAVGRVMTRITNDIEALYEFLRGFGSLIGEFVPFIVALIIMFTTSVKMTLILLLALPIIGVATYYFRRATRVLFRQVRQSVSALNQNMQENLAGLQVVQLSHREDYNHERYMGINHRNLSLETRLMKLSTVYSAFTDSMASIAIGAILWFAGGQVIQQEISLGGMILFTRFIDMLFHPVVIFGEQLNVLFRAMASGERIFQALDWDEKIHEPEQPEALPPRLRGEVEFRHLDFRYDYDVPVLTDVTFAIKPGEKLAIVGPTGSGKSTIIKLLGRFYDVGDNSIFLDGIDLNHIHTRDLRRRIGVVLQDFHIFSGTIHDNIAMGDERITRERAMEAAKTVNANDFIMALPNDYNTELSERGQNISQGQRQLLAFARVLAADPEILVLDEATASIDTETELLIQDALRKLTAGRTSIIIAHRLQTIQEAGRVLVLDHGRVAEVGTHEELLAQGGIYHTLHSLQFQETAETEAEDLQQPMPPIPQEGELQAQEAEFLEENLPGGEIDDG